MFAYEGESDVDEPKGHVVDKKSPKYQANETAKVLVHTTDIG